MSRVLRRGGGAIQRLGQLIENVLGRPEAIGAEYYGKSFRESDACIFQLDDDDVAEIRKKLEYVYEIKYGTKP